jgi:hypothetical protein
MSNEHGENMKNTITVYKYSNFKDLYEIHFDRAPGEFLCDLAYLNRLTKKYDISEINISDSSLQELIDVLLMDLENDNDYAFNSQLISFEQLKKILVSKKK